MPPEKHSFEDRLLITFADVKALCRRGKRKIVIGALIGMSVATAYSLLRPIMFEAEATFREKGRAKTGIESSITKLLFSESSGNQAGEALSIMKSRRLFEPLIQKLGLQASINQKGAHRGRIGTVFANLKVQWAHMTSRRSPTLPDFSPAFLCVDVVNNLEIPVGIKVRFLSDEAFNITYKGKTSEGKLGVPYKNEDLAFTLLSGNGKPLKGESFSIHFETLAQTSKILAAHLNIETDKKDTSLLKIKYRNPHRHMSRLILNGIMSEYQKFLKNEHSHLVQTQVDYLEKRQNDTSKILENVMLSHASSVSQDVSTTGLIDVEKEQEFLQTEQHQYQHKLNDIDLEIQLIKTIQEEAHSRSHMNAIKDPNILNILANMSVLKQQRDTISLALHQTKREDEHSRENFLKHVQELEEVRDTAKEIGIMIDKIDSDTTNAFSDKLLTNPYLMLKNWQDSLAERLSEWNKAPEANKSQKKEQFYSCKENCLAYLDNMQNMLHVKEKVLQERLSHHQNPTLEFQGIDLELSKQLYLDYSKQLDTIQAEQRQHRFLTQQLENNDFEISSLSSQLKDSVSQGMISKASQLSLQLRDEYNRSEREQGRIKEELKLQRGFLIAHLKNNIDLMGLNEQLVQQKMYALQNTQLELLNQALSLSEKHLNEYMDSRVNYLLQEKKLIERHVVKLFQLMAELPNKWVKEQLIDLRLKQNTTTVEEIAKLVESKNISHNLEIIQSAPLDSALSPILPLSPHLGLFMLLGGTAGGLFTIGILFSKTIVRGVQASEDNLKLCHCHVIGTLSSNAGIQSTHLLYDSDLDTLRRMSAFIHSFAPYYQGSTILSIIGNTPDYTPHLARLLSKKGDKVLLISLSFDTVGTPQALPGLLPFLEGSAELPKINKTAEYDFIAAGGISRHASELLDSSKFAKYLQSIKREYDWIIAVSKGAPTTAETERLCTLFDTAVVSISGETLESLAYYISLETPKTAFVIAQQDLK